MTNRFQWSILFPETPTRLEMLLSQFCHRLRNTKTITNNSIVIRLTYGNTTFLMTGDAEEEAEEDMLSSGLPLSADVLKLGHHGSSSSTSDDFLSAVDPTWAVISCAEGNKYGHPHARDHEQAPRSRNLRLPYR